MESLDKQPPNKRTKSFRGLVNNLLTANVVTFGMAVANDIVIGRTPVGLSQVAMEGVDTILPLPLSMAESAETQGKFNKSIRWRSLANVMHLGAASFGFSEAIQYIDNPPTMDARGIAISGLIGLWNLGILRTIRRHHGSPHIHEKVELTTQSVAIPESMEDVLSEAHHFHLMKGRNLNNLETFAKTNIIEAAPALIGPITQSFSENGSAYSVMAANALISGLMINQLYKDFQVSRALPSKPLE